MAQAICFRAQARGMVLHDKEFQLAVSHLQVDLPVVALRPVVLSDDPKTELLMIKLHRSGFIGTYDRDMMNGSQFHGNTPRIIDVCFIAYLFSCRESKCSILYLKWEFKN